METAEERVMYIEVRYEQYKKFQEIGSQLCLSSDELMTHLFNLHHSDLEGLSSSKEKINHQLSEVGIQCDISNQDNVRINSSRNCVKIDDSGSNSASTLPRKLQQLPLKKDNSQINSNKRTRKKSARKTSVRKRRGMLEKREEVEQAFESVLREIMAIDSIPKSSAAEESSEKELEKSVDVEGEQITKQNQNERGDRSESEYDESVSMETISESPDQEISDPSLIENSSRTRIDVSSVSEESWRGESSNASIDTEQSQVKVRRPGLRQRTRNRLQPTLLEDISVEEDTTSKEQQKMIEEAKEKLRLVNGQVEYPCMYCSYATKYILGLKRHMMLHTGKKFKCNYCKKSYTEKSKLVEHVKIKHEKSLTFPCRKCDKVFTSSRGLVYHNVTLHEQRGTTLQCSFCSKSFASQYGFIYHTKRIHGVDKVKDNIASAGDAFRPFSQWEKTTRNPPKHQKDQNGFYHCPHPGCNYKSPQMFHIRRHSSIHTGHQFKCERCHKTFSENYKLKMHIQVKHGDLRYTCEICNKKLGTKQGLKYHKLSAHGGEAKFVCEQCGHKFYNKCMYEGHMNKHKGIKPYSCRDCGKCFYYQTEMGMHKKHCNRDSSPKKPKEKPDKYICHICGDEFKKKQVLTEHVNGRHSVVGNYNCICGANFKWRNSLRSHKMKCSKWISEHGNNFNIFPDGPPTRKPSKKSKKKQTVDAASVNFIQNALLKAQNNTNKGLNEEAIHSAAPSLVPPPPSLMMAPQNPTYTNLYPPMKPLDVHHQNMCNFQGSPYLTSQNLGYFQGPDMAHPQGPMPINQNNIYM